MQRRSFLKSVLALAIGTTLPTIVSADVPSFSVETVKLVYPAVFNVLDFGAVSGQDCTESFQRAISAAIPLGGEAYVMVPAGTYYFQNSVFSSTGSRLCGQKSFVS